MIEFLYIILKKCDKRSNYYEEPIQKRRKVFHLTLNITHTYISKENNYSNSSSAEKKEQKHS